MRIRVLLSVALVCCALSAHGEGRNGTHAPWFGGPPKADVVNLQLPPLIRVRLLHTRQALSISSLGAFTYTPLKKGKPVTLSKKSVLRIRNGKHGMTIGQKSVASGIQVSASEGASLTVNGRVYRGTLVVRPRANGAMDVIEQIGLEDYLKGVLPREVGTDWPADSLKAQAVISRTFVVANMGKFAAKGYDVSSDVYSQMYGGQGDESPLSTQAVEATAGEVLIDDQGSPIQAFFHSSCGGRTENPRYVWKEIQESLNYLDGVRDSYCKDDPFFSWEFQIGADTLQKRLRRAGYRVGTLKAITVDKASPSGRAWTLKVDSSKGIATIQGNAFRLAVGADEVRSTLFTSIRKRGKQFWFEGHGWGHGVGLCQWGARGRAAAGQTYTEILQAYYQNVRLVKAVPAEQPGAIK